jgi:signal transduction histidine kinase
LVKWRTATITKRKEELQQQVTAQTKNIAFQSKQLESQLHLLQSQQIKLEENNKIKARLIAIISHDMISPLKFMGFTSKKLRDAFAPADPAYSAAESLVAVTQELESLSVNMLNWIRFHHETFEMKAERFNLHELIDESVEIVSILAREKGVKLYNDVPESMHVWQYRQAIGVIVYNLAMNAVKYIESGEIRVAAGLNANELLLTVTDTGSGMSPDLVERLNNSESLISGDSIGEVKKFQFGFRMIKDLLRLVNGTMNVQSTVNKGTRINVRFRLPEDFRAKGI